MYDFPFTYVIGTLTVFMGTVPTTPPPPLLVLLTLVSHFGGHTMMYVYLCDYNQYIDAWKNLLDGRRPVRVSGRIREAERSICNSDYYFYGDERFGCRAFPLRPQSGNDTVRYTASATIDTIIDFEKEQSINYYTVLLMNCEIKGTRYIKSRSCPYSMERDNNCTKYSPFSSEGMHYTVKYTYINKAPAIYLSTTQVPYISMYTAGLLIWIVLFYGLEIHVYFATKKLNCSSICPSLKQ